MIAIPEMLWTAFAPQNDVELSQTLLQMAEQVCLFPAPFLNRSDRS
jgi:hypothetical protein